MTSDVSSRIETTPDAGAPDLTVSIDELATSRSESASFRMDALPAAWHRCLAAERERQGLSVADVAARLRLHPKQVAAIEAADLGRLPSGTYLRGFVRNYAQLLGLDPALVVAGLESSAGMSAVPARSVLPHGTPPTRAGEGGSRRLVIGGVSLALVVFAFAGWWNSRESAQRAQAARSEAVRPAATAATLPVDGPATAPPGPQPGDASQPSPPAQPAAAETSTGTVTPGASPAVAAALDGSATANERPEASIGAAGSAVGDALRPVPTAQTGGVVRLRFQVGDRPSWIEVVDSRGQLLLAELQRPGTDRTVDGRAPLRVTVGNASAVQVEARGRLLDLRQSTSANDVARLTID